MPKVLYLIGCQGSGKTTLAECIARGTTGSVVIVTSDEAGCKPDIEALRAQHPSAALLIVEGTRVHEGAGDQLRPSDWLLNLSRPLVWDDEPY